MRRYGRIVLGGTFDRLHVGHEALLATAFSAGRTVAIGLTSAAYLASHPKPGQRAISSERSRRRALQAFLRRGFPGRRWSIVAIDDRYGGSVEPGVDALVVSADTVEGGRAVNRERRRLGRPAVPLLVVPLVLADDLEPVSSRRIRAGAIDRNGHRLSRITVGLATPSSAVATPAAAAVRRAFPRAHVTLRPTRRSAARARDVLRLAETARGSRELGVVVLARPRGGWRAAVRSTRASVGPRTLPGRSGPELERGLARLLRPGAAKPL